ncbi:MAG TPA: DUF3556 domain-containing protein [Mycobacteriales bacterium]|jgi:hypothetical protein|nr:DUF3556 domain-containing protein [Mycobacteriales bacterium]
MSPATPEFDVDEWLTLPYYERVRAMCRTWAMQGFGAPAVAYVFYLVKLAGYVGGFLAFACTSRGLALSDVGSWWASPVAFEKAVLWTMLYEAFGFGCASGPLTARYLPPVTAFTHWLRPGTTRLAPFPRLPMTGGTKRSVIDVLLFAAFVVFTVHALLATGPTIGRDSIWPILVLMLVLGLRDKTVFLAARSEHYLLATFVFLFPHDLFAGSKAVQLALWFGAATSKLNRHFPNVIAVMLSNNPLNHSKRLRKALYRSYPDDLRGSRLAALMADGATVVEYAFPLALLLTHGGIPTYVALAVMVAFHANIFLCFAMGVPQEWNVFFIYSGLALFGEHSHVTAWSIHSPWLGIVLIVCLIGVPALGNLRPDLVSFLPSMRYYAGNWGTSVWLWRPGALESLDDVITKSATSPRRQLERLYGPPAYEVIVGRVQAFRAMHLHGRALNSLLPKAIADLDDPDVRTKGIDAFEVVDGEFIAGLVLGWNFGDGHLHHEQLLAAIGERRGFAPGELRCIFLESQPALRPTMHWRIVDAAAGAVDSGHIRVSDLLDLQPWGEPATDDAGAGDVVRA